MASSSVARAVECCLQLSRSGCLRVPVSAKSDAGLRLRDIAGSKTPCRLVVYWGAWKSPDVGPRHFLFLETLGKIRRLVETTLLVPASVEIVFTDTHALANGVDSRLVQAARAALVEALPPEFNLTAMSSLLDGETSISLEDFSQVPGAARLVRFLEAQAAKLFDGDAASQRASDYLLCNLAEAPRVAAAWPLGLFVHLGPPELRLMLPSLPFLHASSGPGGASRKPWFD